MKQVVRTTKFVVLPLVLLTSLGCIGIKRSDLMATQIAEVRPTVVTEVWQTAEAEIATTVAAALTSVAVTKPAQVIPTATPSPQVALLSFHGRYVTAMGGGSGWLLRQEPELSECGWFTLHYLDNGNVVLETCYSRFVTAPISGSARVDWMLWQEPKPGDCVQFTLHESSAGVAIETCVGRFFTAGDGNWPGELAWSVVAETDTVLDWELFTLLRRW